MQMDVQIPARAGSWRAPHVTGGQRYVEQAVEARMQRGAQLPAQRGLAGTDLAGDQPDAAQLDEVI